MSLNINPASDTELFDLMRRELFSAILGDVLDLHGYRHQFLSPECRPLAPGMIVCGRAMTVLETDVTEPDTRPFGLMLKALDSLQESEVYLAAGCSRNYALWGELMTIAAQTRKAAGVVLEGYARDTNGIVASGFPVFCHGSYAQDQRGRGRVTDYRVPLRVNDVTIEPGDIVFGDVDGVVIVPRLLERDVIVEAIEQVRKEKGARKLLLEGVSAEVVFTQTGVL